MPIFRRKPTTVEAFQWTGDADQRDDPEWIVDAIRNDEVRFNDLCSDKVTMVVTTIHGDEAVVRRGDWVAREPMAGRFYPIRDDVFRDITSSWRTSMDEAHSCGCIGPQNGEPRCPCMMRGVVQRDGRWIEQERDLGPVRTPVRLPATFGVGCVCPAGAEATCQGPLCPRKPIGPATS